jgi:hypothetical protein
MYHLSISIMPSTNVAFISHLFSNMKDKYINFIHNTKYYNCKHTDVNIQNPIHELDNNSKTVGLPRNQTLSISFFKWINYYFDILTGWI